MSGNKDLRTYLRADCAVFRKTAEAFGGLSNIAPGFPVQINGARILTVEAFISGLSLPASARSAAQDNSAKQPHDCKDGGQTLSS